MHKRQLLVVVLLILCAAAAQRAAVRSSGNPSPSKNHDTAVPPSTTAANLATARKMPNGAGKEFVVSKCGTCHALSVVIKDRKTHKQWIETISTMSARGMQANEDEMFSALRYLDKYYGQKTSAKSLKPAN